MNLLQILKKNGTGVLKGLCTSEKLIFGSFVQDHNSEYVDSLPKEFKVKFSLNEKYLGEYEFRCESHSERFMGGMLILNKSHKVIAIDIKMDSLGSYGKFTAILER
jgi:hypothetical protein